MNIAVSYYTFKFWFLMTNVLYFGIESLLQQDPENKCFQQVI